MDLQVHIQYKQTRSSYLHVACSNSTIHIVPLGIRLFWLLIKSFLRLLCLLYLLMGRLLLGLVMKNFHFYGDRMQIYFELYTRSSLGILFSSSCGFSVFKQSRSSCLSDKVRPDAFRKPLLSPCNSTLCCGPCCFTVDCVESYCLMSLSIF